MSDKFKDTGYTIDMLTKKAHSFSIGDRIGVVNSEGEEEIATIERFFSKLVLLRKDNGLRFTLSFFDLMGARVVKPANFQVHSEAMDQEAVANALDDRKADEENGE